MGAANRLWVSLGVYVIWIAITLVGGQMLVGENASLDDIVKKGIAWNLVGACALLIVAILVFRWNDLRFVKPHSLARAMWFPLIYLLLFAGGLIYLGFPPAKMIALVALNTLFVGFSEEVMFRGVIFRALDQVVSIWPAIIVTSVLFGAVHTMNVFITGELSAAIVQSVAAALSGLVFMAILIRTGSIWPAIIYHALWDCLIFLLGNTQGSGIASDSEPSQMVQMLMPLALNMPNLIFALILLRNVGKHWRDGGYRLDAQPTD